MSRFSESGSKILPYPKEFLSIGLQELAVFGKGGCLLICLLGHVQGSIPHR